MLISRFDLRKYLQEPIAINVPIMILSLYTSGISSRIDCSYCFIFDNLCLFNFVPNLWSDRHISMSWMQMIWSLSKGIRWCSGVLLKKCIKKEKSLWVFVSKKFHCIQRMVFIQKSLICGINSLDDFPERTSTSSSEPRNSNGLLKSRNSLKK